MNGYWQLPLDPNSVATSAFVTPWGLYEWLVTPFGLTGAPASFQRIMQNLMRDFIGKFAFVYLDDFICYSSDFEDHLEHLGKIFDKLRAAGLKINPKKCSLFKQEVTFLGFVIDSTGLHPDPRLLTAIENRLPPRNPKEIASFLGLTGYFRRFVQGYAKIAEPLTRLLRKTEPWTWDEEQQQAFETLKQNLISYPVLRRIDFSLPFRVYTDASTKAVGAILCQHDAATGLEYVCAYHSKKLTPAERNWGISELECYAVVDALCNAWKDVLLGHNGLSVVTDHTALRFLLTSKHLTGRLARWSLRLQELMPFTLEYRRGRLHQSVDALTRDPTFDTAADSAADNEPEPSTPIIEHAPDAATPCQPDMSPGFHVPIPVFVMMPGDTPCDCCCTDSTTAVADNGDNGSEADSTDTMGLYCLCQTDEQSPQPKPSAEALSTSPRTQGSQSTTEATDDQGGTSSLSQDTPPAVPPFSGTSPGAAASPAGTYSIADELPPGPCTQPVPYVPWRPRNETHRRRSLRICIDGNIGSGKSTIMDLLFQALPSHWWVMTEPVEYWEDLLAPFYQAPLRSATKDAVAALLQVQVLCAYAMVTPTQAEAPWVILERGPWSSLSVFLPAQDLPAEMERVVYDTAHCMSESLHKALPTAVIYLRADPEVCLERVNVRQRQGEEAVSLSYLQTLHSAYETAVDTFAGVCHTVDANRAPAQVLTDVLSIINELVSTEPRPYNFYLPRSIPAGDDFTPRVTAAVTIPAGTSPDLHREYPGQILMVQPTSQPPTPIASLCSSRW
jgi:thymidylate kinase